MRRISPIIGNFGIPLHLSFRIKSNLEKLFTLVNNGNIESNGNEVAKTFNDFFSNIVKNLKIPKYQCEDDLHNRLSSHPALQAILKYRNHPSINNIRNSSQKFLSLFFTRRYKHCTQINQKTEC